MGILSLRVIVFTLALQSNAVLLPVEDIVPRTVTTTPAAPACTADSDVVVNGAFYGYPNQPSYAPWVLTPTGGSPGCQYINSYTPCEGDGGFGAADPDCFTCEYGKAGGSTTISQDITFAPNCQYIVEATVACWASHNYSDYGTPHVFFRITLDHTIIIPQQLSCPSCTSQSQPGCENYPQPKYKVVSGTFVTPASGKGTLKVLISQPAESVTVSPLLLTAVRMITPGTGPFT